MTHKKSDAHKFQNPQLNTPIQVDRPPLTTSDEDIAKRATALTAEQMRKFELLFAELGVDGDNFLTLAFKLALLYVPGMQITFDRTGPGRPKSRNPLSDPTVIRIMVDATKRLMGIESDAEALKSVLFTQEPDMKSPARKAERDKRLATLANLLSKARTDAAQPRH